MTEQRFDPEDFHDSGRQPEGEIYPGFWWVQWSGLQHHSFVVKGLYFRRVDGSATSAENDWILEGLIDESGGDLICGALPTSDGSNPVLRFTPDHRGRARATHVDTHGEGVVTLTSLGENLVEGLTGYRLEIDRESEFATIEALNRFLAYPRQVHLDDLSYELLAEVGAFADKVWSIELGLNVDGVSTCILELDGAGHIKRRKAPSPRVPQHMLDMAEFEGYREFGPLDSSTPHNLHMRSLSAAAEAINTPIALDAAFLELLKDPGDEHLITPNDIPRALFIAALMVVGANRTGQGRFRADDWPEANEVSRWILALDTKSGLIEQREMMEMVFGAVASLTTAEQADTLIDAELFVSGNPKNFEARYPGLVREIQSLRGNLLWRVRRDELVVLLQELSEDWHERFQVVAKSPQDHNPSVFTVDLADRMVMQMKPRLDIPRPEFVDLQHKEEYWLAWEPDFSADDSLRIDLDHDLVQSPEIVAGIITHAMQHREGFNPERLSWEAMPLSKNAS